MVSEETLSKLNENSNNYIEGSDDPKYRAQALEWDAVNFANQKGYINETNKDLVTYEGSWGK